MDTHSIVKYMQTRENGFCRSFNGLRRNIYGDLIGVMACRLKNWDEVDLSLGSTFSCKFSRNKNNLHVAACSTEKGEILVQNTHENGLLRFTDGLGGGSNTIRESVHANAIFNFAWADTKMKLVTASGDHTSKLIDVLPSGKLKVNRQFDHYSSVKSVMFCPGSSEIFCGGTLDGSIKVWDARVQTAINVISCSEHHIPNSHAEYNRNKKTFRKFGVSSVIYQNDLNVISCSSHNVDIKVWDLRRTYRQVKGNNESLSLKKYTMVRDHCSSYGGFSDLVLDPHTQFLYAIGTKNIIYCFELDSYLRTQSRIYTGHIHETPYSKISLTHDGRYLFSGCTVNIGVIYSTALPHIEKPVYKLNHERHIKVPFQYARPQQELSVSDWCADPATYPKLITSSDSLPLVWSLLADNIEKAKHKFIKTPEGRSMKPFRSKIYTVPIKLDAKLKEENKKQIEEHLQENWDTNDTKLMSNITTPASIKPLNNLFIKTELSSASSSVQQVPEKTTPKSKKRKRSSLSPKCLIDHYLIGKKRDKLDTVDED